MNRVSPMPAAHPSSRRLCGQARPGYCKGGDTGVAIAALTTIDDAVQSDLAQFLHFAVSAVSSFSLRHSHQSGSCSWEGSMQNCVNRFQCWDARESARGPRVAGHRGGLMFGIESGVTSHRRLVLHSRRPKVHSCKRQSSAPTPAMHSAPGRLGERRGS